jgi:uncharacterized membrane protein YphA (DoxX/SURF4 family)
MNEVVGKGLDRATLAERRVEKAAAKGSAGTALRIASWGVQILAAGMFLMAGSSKLGGAPQMVGLFEAIGIGQWFRYLTGALEVAGAVMLVVPRLVPFGAAVLVCVMVGAVATHAFVVGGNPTMAIVLLVAVAFVAWVHREKLADAIRRARG